MDVNEFSYNERRLLQKSLQFYFDVTVDDIAYGELTEGEIEQEAEKLRLLKNLMVKFTLDSAIKP